MSKIMLVEDDNNLREIYEARLLAEGYEVISAKDGEEALALATKERPDLIISDVMMPKISGFDMLDILRSTPGVEQTKVVMMTALSQAEDKARADKLGADRYLVKSQVTLEDVAKVADELLNGTDQDSPEKLTAAGGVIQPEEQDTIDTQTSPVSPQPPAQVAVAEPPSEDATTYEPSLTTGTATPTVVTADDSAVTPTTSSDDAAQTPDQTVASAAPSNDSSADDISDESVDHNAGVVQADEPSTSQPTPAVQSTDQPDQTTLTAQTTDDNPAEDTAATDKATATVQTDEPQVNTTAPSEPSTLSEPSSTEVSASAPAQPTADQLINQAVAEAAQSSTPTPQETPNSAEPPEPLPPQATMPPANDAVNLQSPPQTTDADADADDNNSPEPEATPATNHAPQPFIQPDTSAPEPTAIIEPQSVETTTEQAAPTLLENAPTETPPKPLSQAPTTASEEADIEAQIDDFVQTLQSNDPESAEVEPKLQEELAPPEDTSKLDASESSGSTLTLPTSGPTQQLEVKEAPADPDREGTPVTNVIEQAAAKIEEDLPEPTAPADSMPHPSTTTVGGQRVIQPLVSPDASKPNLSDLAQAEGDEQQPLPANSVVAPGGETVTPASPSTSPDDKQPGNIIQPVAAAPDDDDPASIAL
jgi:CheY-like chemotaxis protein